MFGITFTDLSKPISSRAACENQICILSLMSPHHRMSHFQFFMHICLPTSVFAFSSTFFESPWPTIAILAFQNKLVLILLLKPYTGRKQSVSLSITYRQACLFKVNLSLVLQSNTSYGSYPMVFDWLSKLLFTLNSINKSCVGITFYLTFTWCLEFGTWIEWLLLLWMGSLFTVQ